MMLFNGKKKRSNELETIEKCDENIVYESVMENSIILNNFFDFENQKNWEQQLECVTEFLKKEKKSLEKIESYKKIVHLFYQKMENNKEKNKIIKYNKDYLNPITFLRFFNAFEDVDTAVKQLIATTEWRSTFKPHEISIDYIKDEWKKMKYDPENNICKCMSEEVSKIPASVTYSLPKSIDKDGYKMMYVNLQNAMTIPDLEIQLRHFSYSMESMYTKILESNEWRFSVVADCANCCISMIPKIMKIGSTFSKFGNVYYCDCLHKVYLINCPWIINRIFKVAKLFLDPVTIEKFVFLKNKEELQTYVEPEKLSEEFGGKLKKNTIGIDFL